MQVVEKRKIFYTRRVIFLLMAVAVAIPLLVRMELPMVASWPARDLYQAVDAVPSDKIVVVSANWEAGAKGENWPQTEALIHHLAKEGKPFAIWCWNWPQGAELTQEIAEPLAQRYGRKYGEDWVNWGFKTGGAQMLRGWAKDIWGIIKEDRNGTPVKELPFMQNVHSHKDIGLIVEITPAATVDYYIEFLYGIHGVPIGYACTGVMAAEAFPYLDSDQLVGMMRGLAGAAEYEKLVGFRGDATRRMSAQSVAHMLIIALIIVGNAGYFLSKRRRQEDEAQMPTYDAPSPPEERRE